MIGHSGSHTISSPSIPLLLLLLLPLLMSNRGGVAFSLKEEIGQMDQLRATYLERLELLNTVLALDEQWSAVWSEKIKPDIMKNVYLIDDFCPSMDKIENDPLDTFAIIKNIMKHCPHSGMYVEFAINLLATSVKCLFYRYSIIQLDTVQNITDDKEVNELALHLQNLVKDLQMIANRLVSVGVELKNLIALARFFTDISEKWNDKKRIVKEAKRLSDNLKLESKSHCAMTPTTWYSQDGTPPVILKMKTLESIFQPSETDNLPLLNLPESEIPTTALVRKAYWFRIIFRNTFEKMLLGKLPPEVWKLIFEHNILVKQIEVKKNSNKPAKTLFSVKPNIFNK